MSRTHLAVTTAFLAVASFAAGVLLGSPAEACVSCNYTPEVVNTPVGKPPKANKVAKPERTAPSAKKHIARKPPAAPAETAKSDDTAKDVATGSETGVTEPEVAVAPSGSATTALARQGAIEPKPETPVGCKRFSAAIGATVEVPCE